MAPRTDAAKAAKATAATEEFCARYTKIDDCRNRVKSHIEKVVNTCNTQFPNVEQEDEFGLCVGGETHKKLQPLLDIYYPAGEAAVAPAPVAPPPAPLPAAPAPAYTPPPAPVASYIYAETWQDFLAGCKAAGNSYQECKDEWLSLKKESGESVDESVDPRTVAKKENDEWGLMLGIRSNYFFGKFEGIKDAAAEDYPKPEDAFNIEGCVGYGKIGPGFTASALGCFGGVTLPQVEMDGAVVQKTASLLGFRGELNIGYLQSITDDNENAIGLEVAISAGGLQGSETDVGDKEGVDDGSFEGTRADNSFVTVSGRAVGLISKRVKVYLGYEYWMMLNGDDPRTYENLHTITGGLLVIIPGT